MVLDEMKKADRLPLLVAAGMFFLGQQRGEEISHTSNLKMVQYDKGALKCVQVRLPFFLLLCTKKVLFYRPLHSYPADFPFFAAKLVHWIDG